MTHYVISFSGGVGSAATVLLAHKMKLKYTAVFADTLIEDEDLYRFMSDIERVTKPIVKLKNGMTPWDVFVKERYIGNSRTAHCSQRLKTDVVREWMMENCPNSTLVLGMSLEEHERIERAKKKWSPIKVTSLLIENNINSRCTIESLIHDQNIPLPRLYDYGFPHNNCGGFCCRAGLTQFATLLSVFPERFEWHVQQEKQAYAKIGPTARPFLKHMKNGVTSYLTLETFRNMIQKGEIDPPKYDYGGCACFVDEIEDFTGTDSKSEIEDFT